MRTKIKYNLPYIASGFESPMGHSSLFKRYGVVKDRFNTPTGESLQDAVGGTEDTLRDFSERTAVMIAIDPEILCQ